MKHSLLPLALLFILSSCAPKSVPTTKAKISLTAALSNLSQQFNGGLYLTAYHRESRRHLVSGLSTNDVQLQLENGTWDMTVIGWISSNGPFEGTMKCDMKKSIQLTGGSSEVSFTLSEANCGIPEIVSANSAYKGVTGEPLPVRFHTCSNINSLILGQASIPGNKYCNGTDTGYMKSFKIVVFDSPLSADPMAAKVKPVESDCFSITAAGAVNSNLKLPVGALAHPMASLDEGGFRLPVVVKSFSGAGCSGAHQMSYEFPAGLGGGDKGGRNGFARLSSNSGFGGSPTDHITLFLDTPANVPHITSISPAGGPPGGGSTITISGLGFLSGATVTLGGTTCSSPNVINGTSMTCVTGTHGAGIVDVVITNGDGQTVTALSSYNYQLAPTVSGISPNHGSLSGGTSVTVSGTGFLAGASLAIAGSACTGVVVLNSTSLTCTTGAHAAGTGSVVVSNPDSQVGSLPSGYTYQAAPAFASISPAAGSPTGSTPVTITGTNFLTGATVTIGGAPCTSLVVVNSTTITCSTVAHTAGVVSVVITNNDAQTSVTANAYTYQSAPTVSTILPTSGAAAGGTAVTVTGMGFLSGATVSFGGSACASVVVVNPTTITCITGSHSSGVVSVSVTNADSQTGLSGPIFTYNASPTVAGVTPAYGGIAGGTSITINGTNFAPGATVSLGGSACGSVVFNSSTSLSCITGAHGTGNATAVVTNPDSQSGNLVNAFLYQLGFISSWTTTAPSETITLPLRNGAFTYDFVVNWGDGSPVSVVTSDSDPDKTHAYAVAGNYTVTIHGILQTLYFNSAGDKDKITSIPELGDVGWTSFENAFSGCSNLTSVNGGQTSGVTNMEGMFYGATQATPSTGTWDTSNVGSMRSMFRDASAATPNTASWNTSAVTSMDFMFFNAVAANPNVAAWDVGSVVSMYQMFRNALAASPNVTGWDVGSVTDMTEMFYGITASPNVSSWDVGSVVSMNGMFRNMPNANPNVTSWNTVNVTSMAFMFAGSPNANPNVAAWNTSNVTNMADMFSGATSANPNVTGWVTSSVQNMSNMFAGASTANPDVASWDTASVTTMQNMFYNAASANPDTISWDIGNVTTLANVFNGSALNTANWSNFLIMAETTSAKVGLSVAAPAGIGHSSGAADTAKAALEGSPRFWTVTDVGIQ